MSSGQDAAWIDDLRVEQASLAVWRPGELSPNEAAFHSGLWRVPGRAASDVNLRVRARLGEAVSPWTASEPFVIDQPTAVSLASFEAGVTRTLGNWPTLLAGALVATLAAGGAAAGRRRRTRPR